MPEINSKEAIVWLDPLDGLLFILFFFFFKIYLRTLDYVNGDLEFVTTLLGVS